MNIRTMTVALAMSGAFLTPLIASADVWHQEDSEIGYSMWPQHGGTGKSRAQVLQELETAKADKRAWFFTYRNLQMPVKSTKTRDQVQQELEAMTADERTRLSNIYSTGG